MKLSNRQHSTAKVERHNCSLNWRIIPNGTSLSNEDLGSESSKTRFWALTSGAGSCVSSMRER